MSGRGVELEAWCAAQLAHPSVFEWLRLQPKVRGYRGRLIPVGVAPPDYLVCLSPTHPGLYVECKETAAPALRLDAIEEHQAAAMSRRAGSCLLVRYLRVPRSSIVLIPWDRLADRWQAHHERRQVAIRGTASITLDEARAIGCCLDDGTPLATALAHVASARRAA